MTYGKTENFSIVMKTLANKWSAMSKREKEPYYRLYVQDRQRFDAQLEEFWSKYQH